jgi:hypothetical protein
MPHLTAHTFVLYGSCLLALYIINAEVAEGLMGLMMNIRAWAEARPAHEAAQEKERLISEIQQIENREREQGMSVPSFWGALASSIAP